MWQLYFLQGQRFIHRVMKLEIHLHNMQQWAQSSTNASLLPPRTSLPLLLFLSFTSVIYYTCIVGISTRNRQDGPGFEPRWGRDFPTRPDQPRGPPSLLYIVYWVSFPGVKQPRVSVDHPPPSSAQVEYGLSYTSTSTLCLLGMIRDSLYLQLIILKYRLCTRP